VLILAFASTCASATGDEVVRRADNAQRVGLLPNTAILGDWLTTLRVVEDALAIFIEAILVASFLRRFLEGWSISRPNLQRKGHKKVCKLGTSSQPKGLCPIKPPGARNAKSDRECLTFIRQTMECWTN
jgi:hypothetical protein